MPPKASRRRRRTAPRKKQNAIEIVVRRGAMRRFDALKTRTSELPVVVTWDRRDTDRRGSKASMQVPRDRRATDRRQDPPFTWELADFVVVPPPPARAAAPKKKAKKR